MKILSISPFSKRLSRLAQGTRILLAAATAASLANAQTAPTSLSLPVNQNFGTTSFSTLPSGFAAWSGLSGATINTQTLAETSSPTANATLATQTMVTTTGGAYGYAAGGDGKFYVQTSSNATSGVNQLVMGLNCSGKQGITVGYTLDIVSAQPRTVGVVCQYRVGNTGNWSTLITTTGINPFSQAGGTVGLKTTVTATLPVAVDDQGSVQVRWATWRGLDAGNSSGFAIDNITANGSPVGGIDTTPPLISTFSPTSGSTGVPVETNLVATFNEFVVAGTGNFVIRKISDNSSVATIPIGSSQVTGFGTSSVTINPTANLVDSTAYYVEIPSTAIKDITGNPFAGISGSSTWTFTTLVPDVTAPTLVSVSPTNGATGVNPTSTLTLTFSEPVQVPLFSGPFIRIKNASGVVATIDPSSFSSTSSVSINGAVATITIPSSTPLEYGVNYYVEMDSGAIEDLASNPFAGFTGSSTWAFTTANVPALTSSPYTQNFATYVSAATLPFGWSAVGGPAYLFGYVGDWASISDGGFRGNASVYGYHHTSLTLTATPPLQQILTLRNSTGVVITDLTVAYKGRSEISANTRIPLYTVSIGGTEITALSYSTADGDNAQRRASISSLSIAAGATFQIKWSSAYPAGGGSARQIGISDVSVGVGSSTFSPTVAGLSVPVASTASSTVTVNANVISSGGPAVTARGFVYAQTSVNSAPQIGGNGVTTTVDAAPAVGTYTASLTGLTAATNYTVRGYATNSMGTSYTISVAFTTLAPPPTFLTRYTQEFDNYLGTNPVGWTAISDSVTPIQSYAGTWGTGSATGGFLGGATAPGVLGYRHTGSSGTLIVTLRLVNGTGANLTALNISYLGRTKVSTTSPEGRSPKWTVTITTGAITTVIPALAYSTASGLDATVSANLSGLTIAPGAEFSLSWASDRDATGSGSSKQIGIAQVAVSIPSSGGYDTWKAANVGDQGPLLDFDNDGVKNGVEYFFGTTGSSFTPNPQPNAAGKISFPHPAATPGANYKVFTSTNLTNWTDVTTSTVIEPGFITYTLPPGQGKIFARLQVDITP